MYNILHSNRLVVSYRYRTVLNFRGSKFSQMAIFEDFVEIIS